ncbi:acyl-CoA dehydrogenase [Desulfosporosinus metallidurans]|uniref:Acyl-CoA dehydrogenase n=1 Tax=Desulfosporosinus metallidurans TaxID=1888891 RepID=A0A1Q8QI01_9FIRM|nr:acyl-CoA dehydrogenase [Desulfosporosinus metallidurans]OLN26951.1 Acyl-CoA dehydrogenase [Desulfosporosinus metallidurans]
MGSNFIYSNREHKFIIKEWLDFPKIINLRRFRDFLNIDDVDQILDQALKACKDVMAPTNDDGDTIKTVFKNGRVTVPPSYHEAYKFMRENGWGATNKDVEDESALPETLYGAVHEFMAASNTALTMFFSMCSGIGSVIKSFGSREQIDLYTPKMFSGVWGATMCLTETSGGSDVGDLLTKAYPTDNPSIYKIKGTKCFISGGDHDLTENIIHLVLARVEGAAPGTKGLSLFIVPRIRVNSDGSLGEFNDVTTVGIEHKMGMNGSPTAVLSFGDENDCYGTLIGDPPDERGFGQGMAQMFKMINTARVDTGHGALAVAAIAYNNSVEYTKQRIQGRSIKNPKAGRVPIIQHADVRRMLLSQKATLEAMRAMIFKAYYFIDLINYSDEPSDVHDAKRQIEVITPLIKAYCSDQAWNLVAEAIQVYGGYGYSEEYPIARQARDSKIFSIWEGTNFIQSMDLVTRKWKLENGQLFRDWFEELAAFIEDNRNNARFMREFQILSQALEEYQNLQVTVENYYDQNIELVPFYSTRILRVTAELYSGCLLMQQALIAQDKLDAGSTDNSFYQGKVQSARFYVRNVVPDVMATIKVIAEGDTSAIDIPEEAF